MYQKIKLLSEEHKEKIFSIGEKNFWPYCKYLFTFYFSAEMLFQLMFHYYIFDKIIKEEKIVCGVLTSSGSVTEKCLIAAAKKDYSKECEFLKEKPEDISLEGFLFPDTYEISEGTSCDDIVIAMLSNFEKKLTQELKDEIQKQKKSVFDIITMAAMLEKEVRTLSDKKIVSGILWKRLEAGMPLQIDATINYITGKSDPGATIKDTKIDSPYNTYKYKGLPKGPISNPGMSSITAAIEPTDSPYWFYLSDGATYFSKTLEEHNVNKAKYLD